MNRRTKCTFVFLCVLGGYRVPSRALGIKHKNKDPANRDRVSNSTRGKVESGSVRLFRLGDGLSLGAFLSLHDFKFNVITFLKAFISFRLDGAIVNKNIGAIFPANEAEALCIVKPLHFTFNSRHVPYSIWPIVYGRTEHQGTILSDFYLGFCHRLRRDAGCRR